MSAARPGAPRQTPIENHGVIGDLGTVALVGMCGAIDFLCWPRFDSPSVFASLLDPERGGHFQIAPLLDGARQRQFYLPDTNVLVTHFLSAEGVAEITDFMPLEDGDGPRRVFRMLRTVRGSVRYRLRCAPRFDYARRGHRLELRADGREAWFRPEGGSLPTLRLSGRLPVRAEGGDAVGEFELGAHETAAFALDQPDGDGAPPPDGAAVRAAFERTVARWQGWIGRSTYQGRYREVVNRSALLLKLLISKEHGSMVAAPTFGLPEKIGGSRNWDYRYTWVRDSAFVLYALMRLGFTEEADRFEHWLGNRAAGCSDGQLRLMYSLDGRADLPAEEELAHLAGHRGSRPVRIGNDAKDQLQLDIYGELMDAVYLSSKYGEPVSYDAWNGVLKTLDWVRANWRTPDNGIWEVRGGRREFLHSRVMCWVAVDRGLRLAQKRSLPAPFVELADARSAIHNSVFEDFWDDEARCFVQSKGSKALDASALMMPLVRFISPTDPRWLSTLDAVRDRLVVDVLVRRYDARGGAADDGLDGEEGSFTTCSFWYVECLARAGRAAEARLVFEKTLGYANHLGLFSEELGTSGEHLGNFPQALTHLALISAAYALDRALGSGPPRPWSR